MNEKFEEKLNLNGPATDKWLTLDHIQKQVDELKNVLINTKEKYAKSIFKEFEESIKPYFGAGVNNQITNASFFQIFIPQVSHKIHFEWCGLSLKTLCSGGHVKFVLHTEYTEANKAVELVVNDAFKNAVKQNGFTFCYEYEESPIRTIITKDVYLKKDFNPYHDLSPIYKSAKNLIDFIQDTRIRKSNENLTEIRNFLLQNTSDIVINEPWLGFDLCMVFNKGKSGEVGIESFYAINDNNELEYRIMISVWKKENWTDHLETKLKENLHFTLVDKETSEMRCWAHLEPINNPSVELIKARLLDVYRIVKDI